MSRLTRRAIGQSFILALGLGALDCSDRASPSEPTVRRMEVENAIPRQVPYGLWSEITVQGHNLDGAREAFFSSSEGVKRGAVLETGSSAVRVQVPAHEWFGQARVILSEGNQPFHERDTLPFRLELAGPEPDDPRIYEYRVQNAQMRRWDRSRFPLAVYLGQFVSSADRDTARAGVELWTNAVEPGLPSFFFVEDSLEADVVFTVLSGIGAPSVCGVVFHPLFTREELIISSDKAQILCKRFVYDGGVVPRDIRVLAAHEMGHVLGLLLHSKRPTDAMAVAFTGIGPSLNDILTLRHLYTTN